MVCLQADSESDDEDGDFFRSKKQDSPAGLASNLDNLDTSLNIEEANDLSMWESEEAKQQLRNRFVTGKPLEVISRTSCSPFCNKHIRAVFQRQ